MQGHHAFDYAVLPHRGDWNAARLYEAADEFLVPLERVRGGGVAGAARPPAGQALRVGGAQVSAVLREPGGLAVRVFNASADAATAVIEHDESPATGWTVDLAGRPQSRFEGSLALRPWEIATLRLDATS
jgi:alpha-mannosidase